MNNNNYQVVTREGMSGRIQEVLFTGTRSQIAFWIRQQEDISSFEVYSPERNSFYAVETIVGDPIMGIFQIVTREFGEVHVHFQGSRAEIVEQIKTLASGSEGYEECEIYSLTKDSYFRVSDFLVIYGNEKTQEPEIPSEPVKPFFPPETSTMVDKYYRMNPDTEDLITGGILHSGMQVLVGSSAFRKELVNLDSPAQWEELLRTNRWCTVTRLKKKGLTEIQFIGIYDNGEKFLRRYQTDDPFLVKLDSIPDPGAEEEKRAQLFKKVHEIVEVSFDRHRQLVIDPEYLEEDVHTHISATAQNIMNAINP
jgi:hypothetical protein